MKRYIIKCLMKVSAIMAKTSRNSVSWGTFYELEKPENLNKFK